MYEVQVTRSFLQNLGNGYFILVIVLYAADGAHAQQKIKLAHASIDTTNAVWYVPKEKGFYQSRVSTLN